MNNRTPLYEQHLIAKARIVNFSGWDMPLHYGSQIEEHHYVRRDAGIFDVSHMCAIDIFGSEARNFLRYLLANDIARLYPGKALYSCMLNEQGGILDDLIVYQFDLHYYRIIVNAGTRQKDLSWIKKQATAFAGLRIEEQTDLAILAVQGPNALAKLSQLFTVEQYKEILGLKAFHCVKIKDYIIAKTGYTGEAGVEIMMPATQATAFWQDLLQIGVYPCGLGARDTLRLEAGFNLYGADMDETTTPLESNLAWTVMFNPDRNFIGRLALEKQQATLQRHLVGLLLETKGMLRSHQKIIVEEREAGEITSAIYAPTLGFSIGLARLSTEVENKPCHVLLRDKSLAVRIVQPPFVRNGKQCFQ